MNFLEQTNRQTYHVQAGPCDDIPGYWWASIPGMLHTQAQSYLELDYMIREAISLMLEIEPDSFDIEIKVED